MKKAKNLLLLLVITLGIGVMTPIPVGAISALETQCADNPGSTVCEKAKTADASTLVRDIINTLLFIVGSISVVVVIVGGILYATSAGDASKVTKAKNTVFYAIIGVVVSFLAYAIVQFVVNQIIK